MDAGATRGVVGVAGVARAMTEVVGAVRGTIEVSEAGYEDVVEGQLDHQPLFHGRFD
jgi:hypothetical protein